MKDFSDFGQVPAKDQKPPKSIWTNSDVFPAILLPFIILVIAALLGLAYSPLLSNDSSASLLPGPEAVQTVIPIKKIDWSPSRSVLEYIKQHPDEPVIFKMTQASLWPASKLWTPEYLEREFADARFRLSGAYVHTRPVFGPYFDASKPFNIEGVRETMVRVNEHATWSPTSEQFFAGFKGPKWHYYTGKLADLPESLQRDVSPIDLVLDLDPKAREENMNIWIGAAGVSAACHYDAYDNINVQLYGRKQWNLYSPTNHTELSLYPFLHFHHAQTQVDVEQPDLDLFPNFKDAIRYEGVTEPGEALYLPSSWFHNVITLNTSINVNSWVKTPASRIMAQVVQELPQSLSVHGAQVYLRALMSSLKHSPGYIRYAVTEPRYSLLFHTGQIDANGGMDESIGEYCLKAKSGKNVAAKDASNQALPEHYHHISDKEVKELRTLAKTNARLLQRIPKDTRDIWLGDHVEYVLAYATQDPVLTAGVLNRCF